MSDLKELEDGLGFVRDLARKSDRRPSPTSIYLMWALISLVGFSLVDFAPNAVGLYWTLAGPLGGVASFFLGWRHSIRHGQLSRDLGVRNGLHWAGMLVAIFLAVPLGATGAVAWVEVHKIILLVIAFGYFLAGVHLDRPLVWVGLLMAAGYVALFFIPAYGWTLVGILMATALVVTGVVGGRSDVAPAE